MEPTAARAIMRTVTYCLSLSVFLIANLLICGKAPGTMGVFFLICFPFTCVIWGVIYFRLFSCPAGNWVNAEAFLIVGFWLTSLVLLLSVFISPRFYLTMFLFTVWNGVALYFIFHKPDALGVLDLRQSNLCLSFIICLCMSLWSQTAILQKMVWSDHITFLPWSDHFVHASIIQRLYECSRIGSPQEFAMMSGVPIPLYHYGSYMVPSVLRAASDIPAINISTAFWLPFGAILSGLGAYVLGNGLWGKREGIASVLAIVLLPDPFMYGCGLGYFSYHFLGQTGAALYYAESIAAVGLSVVGQGIAAGSNRQIFAGLIPILTLVFFKAHVLLIVFPATCIWIMLFFPSITKNWRVLCFVGLITFSAMIALVGSHLGYIELGKPWALEFFRGVFSGASPHDPPIFAWLFGLTQKTATIWDDVVVGTILLWLAVLGPLFIIGVALVVYLRAKRLLDFKDALPFLCLGVWTTIVLLSPASQYGNLDEFHHRPFHVVYYIFFIWLFGRASGLLIEKFDARRQNETIVGPKLKIALLLIAILLLFDPWYFGKGVLNIGPCAERHQNFRISKDLWEAAEFIRMHGNPGDIFLDSHEDKFMNAITGISEHRPFLSEPYHGFVSRHGSGSALIEQRRTVHDQLKQCDSEECVKGIASTHNIRWYLNHPEDKLLWPVHVLRRPDFESNDYKVFVLEPTTEFLKIKRAKTHSKNR